MPDLSVSDLGLLVLVAILAALAGWMMRSRRCRTEKQAVNAGWQHQMDAQQAENERLAEQGSSLMQQVSQYRASNSDIRKRARELSDNLRDEPVERVPLPAGLEASNDQYDETSMHDTSGLVDQTSGTGDCATMPGTAFHFDNEAEAPRDDLQRIKGIGPAIERTLNELGYCSYRQIANMTDDDIAQIADRLRGFNGRIQRENWIGQARDLLRPRL